MNRIVEAMLGDIRPSDVPQKTKWIKVCELWPNQDAVLKPLNLDSHRIRIQSSKDYKFSPVDGNHRVARLIQLFGLETIAFFTVLKLDPDEEIKDVMQEIEREAQITSFNDYLRCCFQGVFYHYSPDKHLIVKD